MRKNSHFSGQPLYGQMIKLLDKSKILHFSRKGGGERYTKRFNYWIHLVVMLYAVIMRFDSLREITTSLLAETRKLAPSALPSRSDAARLRTPIKDVTKPYSSQSTAICTPPTAMSFPRTAKAARVPNG